MWVNTQKLHVTRPDKLLHNYGKIHHFQWVNPLFLWTFSIAMLKYQRVNIVIFAESRYQLMVPSPTLRVFC